MKRLGVVLAFLFVMTCRAKPSAGLAIYVDDSSPDMVIMGNTAFYEVAFRKSNGSIAYVIDKSTGQRVTLGSRHECLWGASYPRGVPDYVGGCSYSSEDGDRFSYEWSAATHTLTLTYTPDPASLQQVAAQVTVKGSTEPWFDLRLNLKNDWGSVAEYILFPSDLVFAEDEIEEALLPILPGIVLTRPFFQEDRGYTAHYPGYPGMFADYVSIASTKGYMAIYSLYGDGPIRPSDNGFVHDEEYVRDSTYYRHAFGAWLANGEAWTSPWVRVRVSQAHEQAIAGYRSDNGLAGLASLSEKLGSRYGQVVASPLYKADAMQLGRSFPSYAALLAHIPVPGILHPVAFQPGGHDENYPDFLPPDPAWGSTSEFAGMYRQAQALGFLVMPYTNPTWWDDESPTLRGLPAGTGLADVTAIHCASGTPTQEYYGSHGGYAISPYAPLVRQRLERLIRQEMTAEVPSDLLFEDQIGARPWLFDCNHYAPYPMAYIQGWLEHTRAYSDVLLMTELAFDRLAETEAGFHGSVLLPQHLGYTRDWWGAGTWRPYPLAPMMVRDKVLFYQHDLAPETMTSNKTTLSWNVALGYMLSYDLQSSAYGGGLGSEWLSLVGLWQKHVLARYADETITAYALLDDDVTRTTFGSCTVTVNWNEADPYPVEDHVLRPGGSLIQFHDGSLTAGVFAAYNGVSLSGGDHCLIERREPGQITVWQPVGMDTHLTLSPLGQWHPGDTLAVRAYAADGRLMGSNLATVTTQGVTFLYQKQIEREPVTYYVVGGAGCISLPLILRTR